MPLTKVNWWDEHNTSQLPHLWDQKPSGVQYLAELSAPILFLPLDPIVNVSCKNCCVGSLRDKYFNGKNNMEVNTSGRHCIWARPRWWTDCASWNVSRRYFKYIRLMAKFYNNHKLNLMALKTAFGDEYRSENKTG